MNIVLLAWWREIVRAPLQSMLSVVGVALGIAAVVAVNVANHSARESFLAAAEALEQSATHTIVGELTDSDYRSIALNTNYPLQPVVSGRIRLADNDGYSATIHGIDPIANYQFNSNIAEGFIASENFNRLLAEPFAILATADTLSLFGVQVGDQIRVRFGPNDYRLSVAGLIETRDPLRSQALQSVLVTDIATAQTVLGLRGRISSIQLQLPDFDEAVSSVESLLPPAATLEGKTNRQRSIASVTEAFQTNLTAMSLLALMVAVFLIYNTMTFLIARRKSTIEILRALGVSRSAIAGCLVTETAVIGVIASAGGFLFGVYLAQFLLALIERSINSLYFPVTAQVTIVSATAFVLALALGIASTMIATLPALADALRITPSFGTYHRRLGHRRGNKVIATFAASSVLVGCGVLTVNIAPTSISLGFVGIYLLVAGYLCLVPMLCRGLHRIMRSLCKRFFGIRAVFATRALSMAGGRTSVAVCALCIAISATVGVGVMISSFRIAVDGWLDDRLRADVYVSAQGHGDSLSDEQISQLRQLPNAQSVGIANWTWLNASSGRVRVFAVDYGQHAFEGYRFKHQVPRIWQRFQTEGVIVSEPYAWKNKVTAGDVITVHLGSETIRFPILGVYYDYSSDRGVVAIHRNVYLAQVGDETITTAAIFAVGGADLTELEREIRSIIDLSNVRIWRAGKMHEVSMKIFDQTFAITAALRSLAVIVAFVAVVSTLAMIQLDREQERRIQSAIGFSSREIVVSTSAEAGVLGLFAALVSLPVGLMLTWLLIWVVNQRSFGWTMEMVVDGAILVQAVVLSVSAAVLAAAAFSWRLIRRSSRLSHDSG